jgi:hypothetical protein
VLFTTAAVAGNARKSAETMRAHRLANAGPQA